MERDDYLREQDDWEVSDEGVRYLGGYCETCALRQGDADFSGAPAVDDERSCGECGRALGVDPALRAEIDAEVLQHLREAALDDYAHGVSTLWPLTESPRGRFKRATIQASLERLEAAGLARRDDSGFDHLEDGEDGWWHVMTATERRAIDDAVEAALVEEQKGSCAAGCGHDVATPGDICGECACEDDSAIW